MSSRFRFSGSSSTSPRGTLGLLIALGLCAIFMWIPQIAETWLALFALNMPSARFWGFLTYPLVVPIEPFFLIFQGLWLWSFGSMIESRLGTAGLLREFIIGTIVCGVCLALVAVPLEGSLLLTSPWLPIAFITVMACAWSPNQQILFWMFPLQLKWLALITGIFAVWIYGMGAPLVGLGAAVPLALGWFYGSGKLGPLSPGVNPFAKRQEKKRENRAFDEFYSKVREREQERAERERLRKLFEDSIDE